MYQKEANKFQSSAKLDKSNFLKCLQSNIYEITIN